MSENLRDGQRGYMMQLSCVERAFGGSSNGRTIAFEAMNEGPIPSPPANI